MPGFKMFILRSGIYKCGKPFIGFFSKLVWFIRLANWVSKNRAIPFNDFPAKADYNRRYLLYEYLIEKYLAAGPVVYFEFGVADGETFGWWLTRLSHPDSRFHGFDTFEGLPEDWGIHKQGSFTNHGNVPAFDDDRHLFYKGLFQQTLPSFIAQYASGLRKLILLDADLYSSTLFALTALAPKLGSGDIIIFDEFFAPQHEFRAFHDFLQAYSHIELTLIGASNNYCFTAFMVTVRG